jgi:hypothetical protein
MMPIVTSPAATALQYILQIKDLSNACVECTDLVHKLSDRFMFSLSQPIGSVREVPEQEQRSMEIGPVASVRISPMVRPIQADLGVTDVYEVERTTRNGDEIYIPSGTKATSGFEDDEDKYEELEEELDVESRVRTPGNGKISRFA